MKQRHLLTIKAVDEYEVEADCSCGKWSAGVVGDGNLAGTEALLREVWREHRRTAD